MFLIFIWNVFWIVRPLFFRIKILFSFSKHLKLGLKTIPFMFFLLIFKMLKIKCNAIIENRNKIRCYILFQTYFKSDFFAYNITYNNKNIKYLKIFELYYNFSNQIALEKFYWLIFINVWNIIFFITKWIVWFILFKTVYNVSIYFLLVYSILYIAHKFLAILVKIR